MKSLIKILSLLSLVPLVIACEEVIELELPESDPQWVIEAQLTDSPQAFEVRISESAGFYETGNYPPVSDALVLLKDADGTETALDEIAPGRYQAPQVRGEIGKTYQLSVEKEAQRFVASSELTPGITVDSISFSSSNLGFQNAEGLQALIHFQDPAGEDTYVRFILIVNDTLQNTLNLFEDGLRDGLATSLPLFNQTFQSGDKVELLAFSLDRAGYEYFLTLADITGQSMGPGAAAPANPNTNWSGNALGYFSASSVSYFQTVVP